MGFGHGRDGEQAVEGMEDPDAQVELVLVR